MSLSRFFVPKPPSNEQAAVAGLALAYFAIELLYRLVSDRPAAQNNISSYKPGG